MSDSRANMGSITNLAERVLAHPPAVAQRRYPLNAHDSNDLPGYGFGDARLPARFWAKVCPTDTCWIWTGLVQDGYGKFKSGTTYYQAHRVIYATLVEFLETHLEIDHLCRNRACVNPAHMEVVSLRENIMRGTGVGVRNAAKTHCIHGHEFTPENTYLDRGKRSCRECGRRTTAAWHKKQRQKKRAA